jgi:hypothetical protein
MESLEREQKQIDCQADELEVELRKVMNTGKLNKYYLSYRSKYINFWF